MFLFVLATDNAKHTALLGERATHLDQDLFEQPQSVRCAYRLFVAQVNRALHLNIRPHVDDHAGGLVKVSQNCLEGRFPEVQGQTGTRTAVRRVNLWLIHPSGARLNAAGPE